MTDEDLFIQAYDEYAEPIFRFCFYRVYNRELARDLMQETYRRVWQRLVDGTEIRNVRAFLYQTARNLVIDHSRKKKELSLEALQSEGFEPQSGDASAMIDQLDLARVYQILKKVDDAAQEIITLRYVEGYRPSEIATLLSLSETAVYVRLHRARKQLKKLLSYES